MLLSDFDYELPEELIAQRPIEPRNASRLMVLDPARQTIEHEHFYDLQKFLTAGDALIFNDTRVIPARLIGRKSTGARVEIFLLRRLDATTWETLVKPGRKLAEGAEIFFSDELSCQVVGRTDFGGRVIEFKFNGVKFLTGWAKRRCRPISTKSLTTLNAIKRFTIANEAPPPPRPQDFTSRRSKCASLKISASSWAL